MKTIAVLTSGGDSPGMNACIRAITRAGIDKGFRVVGVKRGYQGLIDGEFITLTKRSVGNILHTGGTILKTSRCNEFLTNAGFNKALENIKRAQIDGVIVIGGDGSFKGAIKLAEAGVKVIAIPGTIDNDLHYTDYTLGFDTCVNTITSIVNNIRDTSLSHERITVVEVMGAECGDVALSVGAAVGADYIIVPEEKFNINDLYYKLQNNYKDGKAYSIIILSEAVGSAPEVAKLISANTGLQARPLVVGHIQRGGSPSNADRILALRFGNRAVEMLAEGKGGFALGILNNKINEVVLQKVFVSKRKFDHELYRISMNLSK